jgi:hypothetical protein
VVFESSSVTDDFFRKNFHQMVDLRHPLAVLANLILGKKLNSPSYKAGLAMPLQAKRLRIFT